MRMGTTHRRRRTAAVLLAAVTTLALGLLPGVVTADDNPDADRPAVWKGSAGAAGVTLAFDPEPFLPVTDLVNVNVPEVFSEWDGSRARARASSHYPGGFASAFPQLILVDVVYSTSGVEGPPAPPWPGTAEATYPNRPDDRNETSAADVRAGDGLAAAHADRHYVEGRVSYVAPSARDTLDAVDSPIRVGALDAHTREEWVDGVLTVTSETVLEDVRILEQIHIESVHSVAIARSDGDTVTDATAETTLGEVTVSGVPAVIDDTGISIAGEVDDEDQVFESLRKDGVQGAQEFLAQLEQEGVEIRLNGGTEHAGDSGANARTGGLLIDMPFEIINPAPREEVAPGVQLNPLPGDAVVLEVANLFFQQLPDDFPKTVPPGPNVIFRKYFTTIGLGNANARASVAAGAFGGFGDPGGLGGGDDLGGGGDAGGEGGLGGTSDFDTGTSTGTSSSPDLSTAPAPDDSSSSGATGATTPAEPEVAGDGTAGSGPTPGSGDSGEDGDVRAADPLLTSEDSADAVATLFGVGILAAGVAFVGMRLPFGRL